MCRLIVKMTALPYQYSVFLILSSCFLFAEVTSIEGSYFFYQPPEYPRDCKAVRQRCSPGKSRGVHNIKPDGYSKPFEVYCDNQISPGGWTVIQRQIDGSLTFKRNWEEYRTGFAFLSGEYYIGNEKLSYLTNQKVYELRIDMALSNGSSFYIQYNSFRISDAWSGYALVKAEDFSGNSSCVATSCPTTMVHESCSCQTSCRDPHGITDCSEVCGETCRPVGCFVTETNSSILNGETYVAPGCGKMCSCTEGQLTCDNNYRCDHNAVCESRNNVLQCYCNPGYSGDGVNCTSVCQTNEVYGRCSCQKSCSDPSGCLSCDRGTICYCPNGYFLQGGDCVPQERCGCFFDGRILQEGESYVTSGCSRRCTCTNVRFVCDNDYRCDRNAACATRNNVLQCYCNPGYSGDGVNCTSICQTNELYGRCSCQKSCRDPTGCVSCNRGKICYCPNGFYLQGEDCVPQEECGCFHDGRILQEEESYVTSGCLGRCTCTNGRFVCDNNYRCGRNAVCATRNNMLKCYCNPGYSGDGVNCTSKCQTNEVYGRCSCQKSCRDPTGCVSCNRGKICYCPNGFYLQGGDCVPQEECGCFHGGQILREEESYVTSGCSRRCTCTNGQFSCSNNYRCDRNAVCATRNSVLKCYCNPGYSGDGVNCTSICQTNEVFGTCSCQKSCREPTGCVSCNQGNNCYCPNGFYLQGGDCVPQERCGCFLDGRIIQNGETYVNSDCSRRSTCSNDRLNCYSNYRCSPNAACKVKEGVRQCYCNEGYGGDGQTCTRLPARDCNDVRDDGYTRSDVYSIRPTGMSTSFDVFCNMTIDGGAWTVFQRRITGDTNFYRSWGSYKNGFGDIRREFWLGNEKLYYLSKQANYEVRVDYVSSSYSSYYDKYDSFRIGNEGNKYRVTRLGSHSGNGYKSLYNTKNIAFSTYDRDNDGKSSNCAEGHRSGWWHGGSYYYYYYSYCYYFPEGSRHRRCSRGNLNGSYNGGNGKNIFVYYCNYIYCYYRCNIKYSEMKIRRIS